MTIKERHLYYAECNGCGEQSTPKPTRVEALNDAWDWEIDLDKDEHRCLTCQVGDTL